MCRIAESAHIAKSGKPKLKFTLPSIFIPYLNFRNTIAQWEILQHLPFKRAIFVISQHNHETLVL